MVIEAFRMPRRPPWEPPEDYLGRTLASLRRQSNPGHLTATGHMHLMRAIPTRPEGARCREGSPVVRSRPRRRAAVLLSMTGLAVTAIILLPPLFASGTSAALATSKAARLIKNYEFRHCNASEVDVRSARVGTERFARADRWLRTHLLTDPVFARVTHAVADSTEQGDLSYAEANHALTAYWSDYHVPGYPAEGRLRIQGCMTVPSRIEIIDTALGPRALSARILFSEWARNSLLGERIARSSIPREDSGYWLSEGGERVALLRRRPRRAWRVVTITDGF